MTSPFAFLQPEWPAVYEAADKASALALIGWSRGQAVAGAAHEAADLNRAAGILGSGETKDARRHGERPGNEPAAQSSMDLASVATTLRREPVRQVSQREVADEYDHPALNEVFEAWQDHAWGRIRCSMPKRVANRGLATRF